jgi:hypothetical protein
METRPDLLVGGDPQFLASLKVQGQALPWILGEGDVADRDLVPQNLETHLSQPFSHRFKIARKVSDAACFDDRHVVDPEQRKMSILHLLQDDIEGAVA